MSAPFARRAIERRARALLPWFREYLALSADRTSQALATELQLVAWDREQLYGALQGRVATLAAERMTSVHETPVRILERRSQPLEAVDGALLGLLRDQRVCVELERGTCTATQRILSEVATQLPIGALQIVEQYRDSGDPVAAAATAAHTSIDHDDPRTWPRIGVAPALPRIALVDEHADRELAAYVLARTCLRRSGTDPRGVHRAYVVGPTQRLAAHLKRLWVGAQLGPASDADSFAGPVSVATRDAFLELYESWRTAPETDVWCTGGVLSRAGDRGIYLAPAAFACSWPAPNLELVGPMCCIVSCSPDQARAEVEAAAKSGTAVVQIGGRRIGYADTVRHVRGAVLVERLPPGLPEPRPV